MTTRSDNTESARAARRRRLASVAELVLKVGTNVLLEHDGSVAMPVLHEIAASVARQHAAGRKLALVSSGAIGAGAHQLGIVADGHRGACAAVGQGLLTAAYHQAFAAHGLHIAQVLVTGDDFLDVKRETGLRDTLRQILDLGLIPLVNENDAVMHHASSEARYFTDNDHLAALLARLLAPQLLVLLTDVDGLFTLDPSHPQAELIPELHAVTNTHLDNASVVGARGRGGMRAKLLAVEAALEQPGLLAVIANGRRSGILDRVLAGDDVGTVIVRRQDAAAEGLSS